MSHLEDCKQLVHGKFCARKPSTWYFRKLANHATSAAHFAWELVQNALDAHDPGDGQKRDALVEIYTKDCGDGTYRFGVQNAGEMKALEAMAVTEIGCSTKAHEDPKTVGEFGIGFMLTLSRALDTKSVHLSFTHRKKEWFLKLWHESGHDLPLMRRKKGTVETDEPFATPKPPRATRVVVHYRSKDVFLQVEDFLRTLALYCTRIIVINGEKHGQPLCVRNVQNELLVSTAGGAVSAIHIAARRGGHADQLTLNVCDLPVIIGRSAFAMRSGRSSDTRVPVCELGEIFVHGYRTTVKAGHLRLNSSRDDIIKDRALEALWTALDVQARGPLLRMLYSATLDKPDRKLRHELLANFVALESKVDQSWNAGQGGEYSEFLDTLKTVKVFGQSGNPAPVSVKDILSACPKYVIHREQHVDVELERWVKELLIREQPILVNEPLDYSIYASRQICTVSDILKRVLKEMPNAPAVLSLREVSGRHQELVSAGFLRETKAPDLEALPWEQLGPEWRHLGMRTEEVLNRVAGWRRHSDIREITFRVNFGKRTPSSEPSLVACEGDASREIRVTVDAGVDEKDTIIKRIVGLGKPLDQYYLVSLVLFEMFNFCFTKVSSAFGATGCKTDWERQYELAFSAIIAEDQTLSVDLNKDIFCYSMRPEWFSRES